MNSQLIGRSGLDLLVACLFLTLVALTSQFFDEDALIIFRFARNLAQKGALAFNPSDPTYSLTCPAWGALVGTLAGILGLAHHARAVAIALAAGSALVFLWQVGQVLRSAGTWWRLGGLLVMALDPYLVWCAAVGNELPAFLVALMALVLAFERRPVRLRGWFGIGAGIALAYLVRPEAVLLVPVFAGVLLAREGQNGVRPALTIGLGAAFAVLPWLIFAEFHYGRFVPLTVEAKASVSDSTWRVPLRFLLRKGGQVYALAGMVFVVALALARNRADLLRAHATKLLWVVAVVGFYLLGLREHSIANRYLVVFAPLFVCAALEVVLALRARPRAGRVAFVALMGWVVALGVLNVIAFNSRQERMRSYEAYVDVCKWMEASLEEDARVFVALLGGAGWFTDLEIVDNGIISREALAWRRGEISLEELWQLMRPDYAVLVANAEVPVFFSEIYTTGGNRPLEFRVLEFEHAALDAFVERQRAGIKGSTSHDTGSEIAPQAN